MEEKERRKAERKGKEKEGQGIKAGMITWSEVSFLSCEGGRETFIGYFITM